MKLNHIAFIPASKEYFKNKIFDESYARDSCFEPFNQLKIFYSDNNIQVNTIDMYDDWSEVEVLIVFRFELHFKYILRIIKKNPFVKIIFLVTEEQNICPVYIEKILRNKLFDAVLTWRDDMVDKEYFFKCNYPNPTRKMITPISFVEKKYLAIINSNKRINKNKIGNLYIERLKAIHYFAKNSEIDLYGVGWDKSIDSIIKQVYLGEIGSKIEILKDYRYAIAFENCNNEIGGICEKIFDIMAAGCVPIYWGAPNVLDFIPKETFIDFRDFMDYEKIDRYLKSINQERYDEYLILIKKFLSSDEYFKFTSIGFVDAVSRAIDHVSNLPPTKKNVTSIKWEFLKKTIKDPILFIKDKRFLSHYIFHK